MVEGQENELPSEPDLAALDDDEDDEFYEEDD